MLFRSNFEKEMKRKGGVVHGGRRQKDQEVPERTKQSNARDSNVSKRSIDEVDGDTEQSEDEMTGEPVKTNKKAKKEKLAPIKYRMLISKDERWANDQDKEAKDKVGLFSRPFAQMLTLNRQNCANSVSSSRKTSKKWILFARRKWYGQKNSSPLWHARPHLSQALSSTML